MTTGRLRGSWVELRDKVQWRWGELSDQDLDYIAGSRDLLIDSLQDRYGWSRESIVAAVEEFEDKLKDDEIPVTD